MATRESKPERCDEAFAVLPPPHRSLKFPMKFKEFLRRTVGGRSCGERLRMFRKYLRTTIAEESARKMTSRAVDLAVDRTIKHLHQAMLNPPEFYQHAADFQQWRVENRIQQRRDAANKRWKAVKKSVDRSFKGKK